MEHTIVRHKNSGNAYVSHIKGKAKAEALKKKKLYNIKDRRSAVPPDELMRHKEYYAKQK